MNVRPAVSADAYAASRVERQSLKGWGLPAELLEIHPPSAEAYAQPGRWVASDGDAVLGTAQIQRIPYGDSEMVLTNVLVAPPARGRGIGSALFSRVVQELGDDVVRAQPRIDVLDQRSVDIGEHWGFVLPDPSHTDAFVLRANQETSLPDTSDDEQVKLLTAADLTPEMLNSLRELWLRSEGEEFVFEGITASEEEFNRREPLRLEAGGQIATAWEGNRLVGALFASRCADVDEMYHELSYVDPTCRGRGIGTRMKAAVVRASSQVGELLHYSDVQRGNVAIHRVHLKLGFSPFSKTLARHRDFKRP